MKKAAFLGYALLLVVGCGSSDSGTNPVDSAPPSVTLSADQTNVHTTGSVLLTATAHDNVGVKSVEFYEGTSLLGSATQSPFTQSVDYTLADNGAHSYHAVAIDAAGNKGTSATKTIDVAIPSLPRFDGFDDGVIDSTQWSVADPWQNTQGSTVEEKNGQLEMFIPGTATGGTFGEGVSTVCQIVGDFDIQVDYKLLEWPANNGVRAAIGLYKTMERVSFATYEFNGKESYAADHVGSILVAATTDTTGTLRLTRVGDVWSSYYKQGTDWILLNQTTQAFTDPKSITLAVWSDASTFQHHDVRMAFDNFQVNIATDTCQ